MIEKFYIAILYDEFLRFISLLNVVSELFRNALWLNYLEKPSEFRCSLGLSEPKAVLCQIENRAIDDLWVAHMAAQCRWRRGDFCFLS